MKRGCFFSVVIGLTLIIGIGFYIIKNYGDDFLRFGKEKVIEIAYDEIEKKVNLLEDSKYQDSLKIKLKYYFTNLETKDLEQAEAVLNKIEYFIKDKSIDSTEYQLITDLLNKK